MVTLSPRLRRALVVMRAVIGWLAAALGAWFLAVAAGALIPANRDWIEPETGIPIFIETNSVHTGYVLPMRAAGIDWTRYVRPDDFADPRYYGSHVLFGWGNREFYLNVPEWSDLTVPIALGAVFGGGGGLVHVDLVNDPVPNSYRRRILVTPRQYRIIAEHIRSSFVFDRAGAAQPLRGRGYGPADAFYAGVPGYTLANSCNNWTGRGLRKAAIKMGIWTPFEDGVMRWLPET